MGGEKWSIFTRLAEDGGWVNMAIGYVETIRKPSIAQRIIRKLAGINDNVSGARSGAEARRLIRQQLSPVFLVERRRQDLRREILQYETKKGLMARLQLAVVNAGASMASIVRKLTGGNKIYGLAGVEKKPFQHFQPEAGGRTPGQENRFIGVNSSNVDAVGFDPSPGDSQRGTLYIRFKAKGNQPMLTYGYRDAPRWMYDGLRAASSPGRFVWDFVRSIYDGTRNYWRVNEFAFAGRLWHGPAHERIRSFGDRVERDARRRDTIL